MNNHYTNKYNMVKKEETNKLSATSFKFRPETLELLKKIAEKQKRKYITVLEILIEQEARKEKLIK